MCGIAAIIAHDVISEPEDATRARERDVVTMLGHIRHRGDRDRFAECWSDTGVAMGTNRLAIVDRVHGRQPLSDIAETVRVVFNGELYGYESLRDTLIERGHTFRTTSDTEVLVHAYLEWGRDFVDRLDGMYAFVLYDSRNRSFLAARDHIGIKPLYHAVRDGVHHFASEQKCLVAVGVEINTVEPGTYLVNGTPTRYFRLDPGRVVSCSDDEAVATYRGLFHDAVRKQVHTDLPVAVMFSGGIDSAAVLHVARKYHPAVTAVTVGFDGAADVQVARRYCAEFDVDHVVVGLDRSALIDSLPAVVHGSEFFETIDVADACFGSFAYRRVADLGFKVALCGEGSDEVLAGYDLFGTHHDPDELMRYRVGNLHRTDLQRVDRSSMMNTVETRVPFMDRPLLEFSYALPMRQKLRDGVAKWVLREAFRGDLPDYITDRPKMRMPDGSGLKNTLVQHARQPASVDEDVLRTLGIDTEEGAYFLQMYLRAGYPMPRERFKRPGYDYSTNGYFEFVS